ncbi:heterokaryon incompatibility protein-domain-containing protein [Xylaria castorea]|nr:heterokaryon incompatibility protein-domain-containing protein [Xylaria castorea]
MVVMATTMKDMVLENTLSAGVLNNQQGRSPKLYRALDKTRWETRILLITAINPVKLSFEYASMIDDHLDPFEAVSWCWGAASSTMRTQITVDGHRLSIPANAYEVILELCVPQKKKRVWIDAICINQDDIDERSQQVAMMEAIYRKASMTLVWLGKDNGTTKDAMNMIENIDLWRHVERPEDPNPDDELRHHETNPDAFPIDVNWDAIASLFSAAWFTRFWIIQEVALSKHTHVFRGKYEMCWAYLGKTAHYVVHNALFSEKLFKAGISRLNNAVAIARMSAGALNPLVLLETSCDFEATDPRDRVFAMYGLLPADYSDKTQAALRTAYSPDYNKPLVDVYTDVTRATITSFPHSRLSLLLRVHSLVQRVGCKHPDTDFPSWVPRYHFVEDQTRGSYHPANSYKGLKATSFAGTARIDTNTPRNILRIAGVIVDTFSEVCEPLPASVSHCSSPPCKIAHHVGCNPQPCAEHSRAIFERVSQLWYAAITANPQVPPPELATMLRTTLRGKADETGPYLDDDLNQLRRRNFQRFIAKLWPAAASNPPVENDISVDEELDDIDDSDLDNEYAEKDDFDGLEQSFLEPATTDTKHEDDARARLYWNSVVQRNINRKFFVSKSGRMGSAAPGCRKDDKICLLFGLDVPVVLRQENGGWILIGDAYLSGGMNGEHINDLKSFGKLEEETEWFDLR